MAQTNLEEQVLPKAKAEGEPLKQSEQVAIEIMELNSTNILATQALSTSINKTSLKDLKFFEDQSAQISAYLRKNENLLFWNMEKIDVVMNFYISNPNACIKNLFSILMFDWYEISKKLQESYFLPKKFEFFRSSENKIYEKLFVKILNIFDDPKNQEYCQYCFIIINFLFCEVKSTIEELQMNEEEEKKIVNRSLIKNFRKNIIPKLIILVLKVNNYEYRTQVLKLVTAFLDNTDEELYKILKQKILDSIKFETIAHQSACKMSYNKIMKHCDRLYFQLLFLLNENLLMAFKFEYKNFKKVYQNNYGEYWNHAIKQNAQFLYIYADLQQLVDTKEFLLMITEEADLKSKITSTFKKVAEFHTVFVEPLERKHKKLLVRIGILKSLGGRGALSFIEAVTPKR